MNYAFASRLFKTWSHTDIPMDHPLIQEALKSIDQQLESYKGPKEVKIHEIQSSYHQIEDQLWNTLNSMFPDIYQKVVKVSFVISPFGSVCAFEKEQKGDAIHLKIYIRNTGRSLEDITASFVHALLSCAVYKEYDTGNESSPKWKVREEIVDFLIRKSALNKLSQNVTIHELEKYDESHTLRTISEEYYKKLGLEATNQNVQCKRGKYYINEKVIDLSATEKKIFELLYSSKNEIIQMDVLIDALYPEESVEYPEWAISKHLERIRKKVRDLGVISPLIVTYRNQGYKLKLG
jgi:hypothetical protein